MIARPGSARAGVVIGSDAVRLRRRPRRRAALLYLTSPGLWPLRACWHWSSAPSDAVFMMPAVGALPARITARGQLARVQGMRGLAIRFSQRGRRPARRPRRGDGAAPALAFRLAGLLIAVSVPLLISVRIGDRPADQGAATSGTSVETT
ncbi:hypothetical protein GCM10017687_90800 [Streptomyces echinatus]